MKQFNLQPDELGKVPLNLIEPDPEQPRKDFDSDYLDQLAASIKVDGVIQPIVVRSNPEQPGHFFLVAGENRWRASKLAKKRSIPAVLREVTGLNKLLIQLKENHQRKDLNPMEWALAFQTMHKTHGLKQAEIEKILKDSGVGQFGRAYISNIIRLLELPEWAQDLIRHGQLTAAHGKYLIPAMASDKVMAKLQEKLIENDRQPTTRELQLDIYYKFGQTHEDLTGWQTDFNYRETCVAAGCQKMRKISSPHSEESSTYCLDKQCYAILQAEAKKDQDAKNKKAWQERENSNADQPREITISADNRVNVDEQQLDLYDDWLNLKTADFDVRTCEDCQHRHIAVENDDTDKLEHSDACFLVSCFITKEDNASRASRLLSKHITNTISSRMANHPFMAFRLIAWAATACPNGVGQHEGDEEYIDFSGLLLDDLGDADGDLEKLLFKNGLLSLDRFIEASDDQFYEIASYFIGEMLWPPKLSLLHRFKFSIDDYRIDEHYLAEHTEEEIKALFDIEGIPPVTFAKLENACNSGKLDQFALEHRDMVNVPSEIRFEWEQLTKGASDETC